MCSWSYLFVVNNFPKTVTSIYFYLTFRTLHFQGMEADGSPLSSLCMVRAAELFPKPPLEKEDDQLKIPLTECKRLSELNRKLQHILLIC